MSAYWASGRVNLIGEHTDYTGGLVMPVAIHLGVRVEAEARPDRRVALRSENLGQGFEFDLDEPAPRASRHWSDYVRGVAIELERAGHRLSGAHLDIRGDVPMGGGLASSAALEVACGCALAGVAGLTVDGVEMARICQRAEVEFVGARCGIMDQFIACCARAGHALMLDCRALAGRHLPLPEGVRLVVANTMVRHDIAAGEYNRRREECEEGQRLLGVQSLRDVSKDDLEGWSRRLPENVYRRLRHVIGENQRVLRTAEALAQADLDAIGVLMADSHESLRDDYEVSCPELDLMVELARAVEGVHGARMTGGGFGGCTVNLVAADRVEDFQARLAESYRTATGRAPEIIVCTAAGAAGPVSAPHTLQ